jgi:hypothetical protein
VDEALDNKFLSLPERRGPGENKRDPRSDLTGVCGILFYCLTGCAPRNLRNSDGKAPHHWREYELSKYVPEPRQLSLVDQMLTRGFMHEIDFRFQTVDELIGRLREVLNPNERPSEEDLDIVLQRECAVLRKADRKTQLNHFREVARAPLNSEMLVIWKSLWTKVNETKMLHLNHRESFMFVDESSPIGDVILRNALDLTIASHGGLEIHHTIVSQGTECALYREIKETRHPGPANSVEGPFLILRYPGDTLPDIAFLRKEMEVAVGRAVLILSGRIQKARATK